MNEQLSVPLAEARRVYELVAKLQQFFHQPLHFQSVDQVERFAMEIYPELREIYYRVIWDWFPPEVQREIEGE